MKAINPIQMNQIATTLPNGGIPAMSSLTIAEITGKNHADVMRDIRNTLEQAGIVESKFAGNYVASNGKTNPCYHLPRRECDLVVSGYSVKYRLAIIDRWHDLEVKQSFKAPATIAEAIQMTFDLALEQEKELVTTKAELKEANRKIDAYATIAAKVQELNDLISGETHKPRHTLEIGNITTHRETPYNIKEVAAILQVTPHIAYQYVRAGKLPRVKGIHRVLVPARALQEMID